MSAVCKLMPKPPARVESKKQKSGESGALKRCIASSRSSPEVPPSMRQCV
jgi:hypothetical protein